MRTFTFLFLSFFLFNLLCSANPSFLSAQVLVQDFDTLQTLQNFMGNPPNMGQVDTINLKREGSDPEIFSLGSDDSGQYLEIRKLGNKMRHFLRVKDVYNEEFNFLKISFTFSLDQVDLEQNEKKFAVFFTGGNLGKNTIAPGNDQRWGQVSINIKPNGKYFLATEEYDETEGKNNVIKDRTGDYSEKKHVTIVMNNTGGTVDYTGPGGEVAEIFHQMVDVWIEEDRVISNSEAYLTGDVEIEAVKFLVWNNSLKATARLDDLVITTDEGFDPLPVELTTFTAVKHGNDVVLEWETASEKNSSHFDVERSLDGNNFQKVGTVAAAGNSNESHTYKFPDRQAGLNFAGNLYYRLHQIDIDGFSEYSPVSRVELPSPASAVLRIYPNPFSGDLSVSLLTDKSTEVNFRLMTLQGATVAREVRIVEPAGQEQNFRFSGTEDLQAGMYILEVVSAGEKKRYRIMKL